MKAYALAVIVALCAVTSVSSASSCKKNFMNSIGLQPDPKTNVYYQGKAQRPAMEQSPASETVSSDR